MNKIILNLFLLVLFVACKKEDETTPVPVSEAEFKNRSITPSFIKMVGEFSNVGVYPLVSSEDIIPDSNNMVYGGAPDGQGFIKNPTGHGYIMVTNHENTWAVSRLYLDKKLNIVKKSKLYLLFDQNNWQHPPSCSFVLGC